MMILKVFVQICVTIIHTSLGDPMNIEDHDILYRNKSSLYGEPLYDSLEEGEMIGLRMLEARYGRKAAYRITSGQTDEMENMSAPPGSRVKRAMLENDRDYWPLGIVPFAFHTNVDYKLEHEARVSMKRFEQLTCIRFVPWVRNVTRIKYGLPNEGHILHYKSSGCWSYLGKTRKTSVKISICDRRLGIHEISHVLGARHTMLSPSRHGWVKVHYDNIRRADWKFYIALQPTTIRESRYDMSSIMHYNSLGFRKDIWPSMTVLFTELAALIEEGGTWFYNFHQIVKFYKCKERYCSDFHLECVNDGYVSYFEGKCRCLCPPGLDHRTGCRTVIKKEVTPVDWPSGKFGVFLSSIECPSDFSQQNFTINVDHIYLYEGKEYLSTKPTKLPICMKNTDSNGVGWQYGSYCLLADRKGGCPKDFKPTGISIPGLQVTFCCRDDGFTGVDIYLPTNKDFVLLPYGDKPCQSVKGMLCVRKTIRLYRHGISEIKFPAGLPFYRKRGFRFGLCYYTKYDTDCGGEIELSKSSRTVVITSPGYPTPYHPAMNCYWLVKGPPGSTIIVDFDHFDVGVRSWGNTEMNQCGTDYVIIRHTFLGQRLHRLCGKRMDHSFRTLENVLSLNFQSAEKSGHQGFRANLRLHLPEDHCYNLDDKGATYRGKVNFTRDFQACLPWDKVTDCPHHTFNSRDLNPVLDENYCRNPDNSFRPWCYTRTYEGQCERNYCDVCRLEKAYDYYPDCEELKKNGFCEKDPNEALKCAKTCEIPLPRREAPSKCDPPPNLQDAKMTSEKSTYDIGDSVNYTCVEGTDTITRRCHSDGSWSPASYVCGACPTNWGSFNGACYRFFPQLVNQPSATQFCNNQDSVLSTPNSKFELEFIRTVRPIMHRVWGGAVSRIENQGKNPVYSPWKNQDGTDSTFDGKQMIPGSGGYKGSVRCVSLNQESLTDIFCVSNCGRKLSFVCKKVPAPRRSCVDQLLDCQSLLRRTPNVCSDYPDFAIQQCPYSCGICNSITTPVCKASHPGPNVVITDGETDMTRGKAIIYKCEDESVLLSGNLQRVCQANGQLSGEKPVCGEVKGATPNNKVPLINRNKIGKPPGEFTYLGLGYVLNNGENTIHRKGEVTQWRFYARGFGSAGLQIWRKTDETGLSFKLVGQNLVDCLPKRVNIVDIPKAERIRVEQGDVIGVWSRNQLQIPWYTCGYKKSANHTNARHYKYVSDAKKFKVGGIHRVYHPSCRSYSLTAYVNDIV